ncbi:MULTISPECIES: SMI1/KNR4 family protein [Listeria]|uniref:SMI1/KNR4 family protein n=1 Tax=Listeria TaxID=1637 RepID=UPI000B5893FD|nr:MULTISPECIES: SMI1/KNR4 family protein [Listeria]
MDNENKLSFLNKYIFIKDAQVELIKSNEIVDENVPQLWKQIIAINNSSERVSRIVQQWKDVIGEELRNTISYLEEFLEDVEVMRIGSKYYLLYSIKNSSNKILYYTGGNPLEENFKNHEELKRDWRNVPSKLCEFYEILHDGFYYFPSRSMGIDSIENITYLDDYEWSIIEEENIKPDIDLARSYGFFSNGMGMYVVLDLTNESPNQAVLWSAKKAPRYNLDFWAIVDEWIVMGFE